MQNNDPRANSMYKNSAIAGLAVALFLMATGPVFAQAPTNVPLGTGTSANWAGYVAAQDTYTGIGATWTVPVVSATSSNARVAADAAWIGIGGVRSHDLIQAGTQALIQNGTVTYQAWYELLPDYQRIIAFTVHGGDSVSISLQELTPGKWYLIFVNNTTGKQYEANLVYDSSKSSADWIVERPLADVGNTSAYLPLDSFGTIQFTNAYAIVNGVRKSLANAGVQQLAMIDRNVGTLAAPSSIGSDGETFSVARSDTPASSQVTSVSRAGVWRKPDIGVQNFTPGVQRTFQVSRGNRVLTITVFGRAR
jgi:hypothetical protein